MNDQPEEEHLPLKLKAQCPRCCEIAKRGVINNVMDHELFSGLKYGRKPVRDIVIYVCQNPECKLVFSEVAKVTRHPPFYWLKVRKEEKQRRLKKLKK